jgi:hypothetical protein
MPHHHLMFHPNYVEVHYLMDNDDNVDDDGDDDEIHGYQMFDSHREIVEEI